VRQTLRQLLRIRRGDEASGEKSFMQRFSRTLVVVFCLPSDSLCRLFQPILLRPQADAPEVASARAGRALLRGYTVDHLNLPQEYRDSISFATCDAEHMVCLPMESLKKIEADQTAFMVKAETQ
jgi:hypothetical protein